MKRDRDLRAGLAEELELPCLPGEGTVTLSGGRRALIEGQRGILEYTPDRVVVSFGREKLCLSGDGLCLRAMRAGGLLITGRIRSAEWG